MFNDAASCKQGLFVGGEKKILRFPSFIFFHDFYLLLLLPELEFRLGEAALLH